MHILMVADGRSPTTRHWIQAILALNHRVTLVSTYPCPPIPDIQETHVLPLAFASMAGSQAGNSGGKAAKTEFLKKIVRRFRSNLLTYRYLLGPLTLGSYQNEFLDIIEASKPDVIHAQRIPFEGMLASSAPPEIPFVVSIWGNDLTLHAGSSSMMRRLTIRTLLRADGLLADTQRDIRLGKQWGFNSENPTLVVPGGGGIDFMQISRPHPEASQAFLATIPSGAPLVINPRGFRPGSIRTDVFFQSIPLILQHRPDVYFICTAMAGQPEALQWVHRLKLESHVQLLPTIPQPQLWELFRKAEIFISLSTHDGTPNSLLEAMACGCLPVTGDIESLREWIIPGVNGFLVEPSKPQTVAEAVLLSLKNSDWRAKAGEYNRRLIRQRADIDLVRAQIEVFFQRFIV
jgi:glycosyltransferase involved in cell wall biosynthesis